MKLRDFNVLAERLPEIKDIPITHKVQIAGVGSVLGDEDVFSRDKYTCSLNCYSTKGTIFELSAEVFMNLKN